MLSAALRRATSAPRRVVRGQIELVRRSIALFYELDGIDRSMALAAQAFTALIPMVILVAVITEGGNGKSLADQIVDRFGLNGATAEAVRRGLPSTGSVEDGLSGLSVLILVVSALSFTRALQRLYARVWDVPARGFRDTGWGIGWLGVVTLYAFLHPLLHGHISGKLGLTLSFAGGTLFWLFTPYVILARQLPWRRLVPQAVLTAIGMDVFRATSSVYMPHAFASSAKQFGTLGFAFTLVSWLFGAALVLTAAAAIGASLSRTVPPRTPRSDAASGATRASTGGRIESFGADAP
jgi:membrane protein